MSLSISSVTPVHPVTLNVGGEIYAPRGPIDFEADDAPRLALLADQDEGLFEVQLSGPASDGLTVVCEDSEGRRLCSGRVEDRDGTATARLRQESASPTAEFIAGELVWKIVDGSGAESGELTKSAEIFLLPADFDLSAMPRGVPIELLKDMRQVFSLVADETAADGRPSISGLTSNVFRQNPPRYDIFRGAPYYIDIYNAWDRVVFYNQRYQRASSITNSLCNCYDAAAYLQTLLKAAGYSTRWAYLNPFGYLKITNLIGRDLCNNPFYGNATDLRIIPNRDPRRTRFGNHAFVEVIGERGAVIADGCAGPNMGILNAQQYVAAAVDTIVPPNAPTSGTARDIKYFVGVTSVVNLIVPHSETLAAESLDQDVTLAIPEGFRDNAAEFLSVVGAPRELVAAEVEPPAVGWPSPGDSPVLADWELVLDDIAAGYPESNRQWMFQRGADYLTVTRYVSSDTARRAFGRFVALGSVQEREGNVFERGPDDIGDSSAQYRFDGQQALIWTHGRSAVRIVSSSDSVDLAALARWLLSESRPSGSEGAMSLREGSLIRDIVTDEGPAARGSLIRFEVRAEPGTMVDFAIDGGSLMLVEQSGTSFAFAARRAGDYSIAFVAVDTETLMSSQATVNVQVR
jgi:hypothetical protein